MERRTFIQITAVAMAAHFGVFACTAADVVQAARRPNVVFILSDDQAWNDYGFMGHPHVRTPNLDRLAAAGLLYERGYVTAPLCRPSLASLATGLYPHQTGIRGNDPVMLGGRASRRTPDGKARWVAMRNRMTAPMANHPSFIKELKANGYATLQTGKWWEGNPLDHGFTDAMTHGDPTRGGRHGDMGLRIGRETMQPIVDFVDKAAEKDQPFFIWYGVFLPHSPHNAPARLFEKYKDIAPNEPTARYWANVEWFDETCGQLVDCLKEKGQYDNTIFVYTCDNGWVPNPQQVNRYIRSKREPVEAGIRTPIFITHPKTVQARREKEILASNIDIATTILYACGIEPPKAMSGLDLRDRAALAERDRIFVDVYEHDSDIDKLDDLADGLTARVVIDGWDKLIARPDKNEFYDLKSDPDDRSDLAAGNAEKVRRLSAMVDTWLKGASSMTLQQRALAQGFTDPPDEYRSGVKWEWCNGMINRQGVTADLEAMKRVGLGGGKIFNVGGPEGPVRFTSPEWYDVTAHAMRESERLGLQLGINMTEGFTGIGGPWIKPEQSIQRVVWSETDVAGPGAVSVTLKRPDVRPVDTKVFKLKDVTFYRDIKVFAVPQVGDGRISHLRVKKGMLEHHADPKAALIKTKQSEVAAADIVPAAKVIELTDRMDEDGMLKWTAPAGKWTILRMGAASTGACTRPGSEKTRGLEADKLNRETVKFHFDTFSKPLFEKSGVIPGKNPAFFAVDSWEADGQNWSPVLPAEFEKRCGYSLYPFLPVLTGRVVESIDVSERFLWDFRRTIADCIRDNFYGYMSELCEQHGMTFSSEPFTRAAFDGMETTEAVGIPTATFWQGPNSWGRAHNEGKWTSSAGHVTGRKKVSSEAFPAPMNESGWVHYPWTFKWLGDYAYASGINHFSFHCYPLQPWDAKPLHKPGMTFRHWGSQYSRHNTWWEQSVDWQKYQERCQFMLQQGVFQAEALFMTREVIPGLELKSGFGLPLGYDWDMASAQMVREKLVVKDGMICAPSGMKYRILILPDISEISVPLLKKLKALVADGAHVVVSSRPKTSLGLVNYPASKKEVADIAAEMWGSLDGRGLKEKAYGKGMLYWEKPEVVLNRLGVKPDVIVVAEGGNRGKLPVNYLHRTTPEAEIYFVSSSSEQPASGLLSFRVSGRQPEFWHPDSGLIEPCPVYEEKDGRTIVPMVFDPAGSVFVVFRDDATGPSVTKVLLNGEPALSTSERINPFGVVKEFFGSGGTLSLETSGRKTIKHTINAPQVRSLDGDWTVTFDGVAAPGKTTFRSLTPWNEHPDEAIRYFSGTGTYRKTINVAKQEGQRIWLDLGSVEVIATVKVNGNAVGIAWKPPFLVDITDAVHAGESILEIEVANLWANRLIGDERFADDVGFNPRGELRVLPDWFVNRTPRPEQGRKTFTTFRHYRKGDPLFPSGLVGPVSLITCTESENPLVAKITRSLFVYSRNPDSLSFGRHREAPFKKDSKKKRRASK